MTAVKQYLRRHHIALVALFIALGGTSYAAVALPANSVGTGQLKKGSVTATDIKSGAVTGAAVKNGSIAKIDLRKGTIPTALPPRGAAGGDLSGTYPAPVLKAGAVDSAKVADNALTGADVNESTLSGVDAATVGGVGASGLAGIGRTGDRASCTDDDHLAAGDPCGSVGITLPRAARLMISVAGTASANAIDDGSGPGSGTDDIGLVSGNCTASVDNGAGVPVASVKLVASAGGFDNFSRSFVTGALPAGAHSVQVRCFETDGDVNFFDMEVTAVALAAD